MKQYLWVVALTALVASFSLQAQTCNSQITPTTPTSAFTINADGTVTDNRTGLVWDRCTWGQTGADCSGGAATTHSWQGALAQAEAANSANYKGHSDWRLPNIKELTSIVERSCVDPAVNLTLFPNTPNGDLWSSSPHAYHSHHAWFLNVIGGYVSNYHRDDRLDYSQVRLVRGGKDSSSLPTDYSSVNLTSLSISEISGAVISLKRGDVGLLYYFDPKGDVRVHMHRNTIEKGVETASFKTQWSYIDDRLSYAHPENIYDIAPDALNIGLGEDASDFSAMSKTLKAGDELANGWLIQEVYRFFEFPLNELDGYTVHFSAGPQVTFNQDGTLTWLGLSGNDVDTAPQYWKLSSEKIVQVGRAVSGGIKRVSFMGRGEFGQLDNFDNAYLVKLSK